jgi:hypothetical protein
MVAGWEKEYDCRSYFHGGHIQKSREEIPEFDSD